MNRVRIAVIGAGHLGRFHARILSRLPGADLIGVVDPVAEARGHLARELRVQAFAHHADVLDQIDAAVVAVPTAHHHAVGLEVIDAGLAVMVEKPLARTAAEAQQLVAAARRRGVVLQVGHVERFNPAWNAVLPDVRDPKYIESRRTSGFKFRSTDIGVVLDLMIHDLDLVLSAVRSPVEHVDALGISVFGRHEDVAQARLVFENGCVATLNASRASYAAGRTMQLWSQSGFAHVDFATRAASVIRPSETLARRRFDVDGLTADERAYWIDHLFDEHLPIHALDAEPCDQLTAELEDFLDAVARGRQPRVTGEHGAEALVMAERILQAIDEHCWDGKRDGRVGPLAVPTPSVVPAPHWIFTAREAGHRKEVG